MGSRRALVAPQPPWPTRVPRSFGPWSERCRHHAWGGETNAGAWAVRVRDYTRRGPLAAFEGRNRDLAYEDWCDLHFFDFGQEGLKSLLPKGRVPATA